jgi:hypothetical protein
MADHEIPLLVVVQMQEQDGTAEQSAELFLDLYVDDMRIAIEDAVGYPVTHIEVMEPE